MRYTDHSGATFGRLTAIEFAGKSATREAIWVCLSTGESYAIEAAAAQRFAEAVLRVPVE